MAGLRLILLMATGFVAMFIYDTFHAPLFQSFGLDPTALGIAIAIVGLCDLLSIPLSVSPVVIAYFVAGLFGAAVFVPFRTALQKAVPAANIAKVFALSEAMNTVGMLSAPFLGAALAGAFGPGAAFVTGGVLSVGIGIVALRVRL